MFDVRCSMFRLTVSSVVPTRSGAVLVHGSFLNHGWTRMNTDSLPSIRVHLCSSVVEFLFKVRCSMFDVQCSVSLCHPWFQPDRAPSLFTALFLTTDGHG